jgi:hypothetical protein
MLRKFHFSLFGTDRNSKHPAEHNISKPSTSVRPDPFHTKKLLNLKNPITHLAALCSFLYLNNLPMYLMLMGMAMRAHALSYPLHPLLLIVSETQAL